MKINWFDKLNKAVERVSPLKFFIVLSVIFGLLFAFITPPFQGADEEVHFLRAYQISEGNFVVDKLEGYVGGKLPDALGKTIDLTTTHPVIKFYASQKYNDELTYQALNIKVNPKEAHFYDFSATGVYHPISYAPSAGGILFARLLRLSPVAMLYIGRVADLAAWIILMGSAIYLMPRKKWAAVFIGLLPMALFQASIVSTDAVTIGMAAVFIALTLKLVEQKTLITKKQLALLLSAAITMTLTKQIMFILLPLVLLIPAKNFMTKKKAYVFKTLSVVVPIALMQYWAHLIRWIDLTATFTNKQNPSVQIDYVLQEPHTFVNVLWNTNFFGWGDGITRSFIGNFGWSDTALSEMLVVIGYIGLAAVLVINSGEKPRWFSRSQRLLIGLLAVVYWLAVNLALYIYYSPVGFKVIIGLQGRYFLPIALLFIPLFYGSWLKTSLRSYRKIAIFVPIGLLVASFITIYFRYYIHNV